MSGAKFSAGKSVKIDCYCCHGSHFQVCITCCKCKVSHGDSVTKPEYYNYIYYYYYCITHFQKHLRGTAGVSDPESEWTQHSAMGCSG